MLIAGSLTFIGLLNWQLPLIVLGLTGATFWMQNSKVAAWYGIVIHVLVLVGLNYFNAYNIIARVGVSYYVLQNIGVLITVIRGQKNHYSYLQLLLSNVFFPKYISGPILLPKEIESLTINNQWNSANFYYGINRIMYGIAKKMVIADNLSLITNTVFNHPEAEFKAPTVIIASLLFTVEMYVNFSAYTDIALGFGRFFNIKLKENFSLPLRSTSITEYWRKTHISLIDWLTQNFFYYITFKWRKYPTTSVVIAIAITFVLSGVWHGGKLGYLIWGCLNASYLIVAYFFKKHKLPLLLGWGLTFLIVSFSNVFFRVGFLSNATAILEGIQNWDFKWDVDVIAILGNGGYLEQQFQLGLILAICLLFLFSESLLERRAKSSQISFRFLSLLGILIFLLGNFNSGSQFIYMQF